MPRDEFEEALEKARAGAEPILIEEETSNTAAASAQASAELDKLTQERLHVEAVTHGPDAFFETAEAMQRTLGLEDRLRKLQGFLNQSQDAEKWELFQARRGQESYQPWGVDSDGTASDNYWSGYYLRRKVPGTGEQSEGRRGEYSNYEFLFLGSTVEIEYYANIDFTDKFLGGTDNIIFKHSTTPLKYSDRDKPAFNVAIPGNMERVETNFPDLGISQNGSIVNELRQRKRFVNESATAQPWAQRTNSQLDRAIPAFLAAKAVHVLGRRAR